MERGWTDWASPEYSVRWNKNLLVSLVTKAGHSRMPWFRRKKKKERKKIVLCVGEASAAAFSLRWIWFGGISNSGNRRFTCLILLQSNHSWETAIWTADGPVLRLPPRKDLLLSPLSSSFKYIVIVDKITISLWIKWQYHQELMVDKMYLAHSRTTHTYSRWSNVSTQCLTVL